MTEEPEPQAEPGDGTAPTRRIRPKRGAFPTPRSELAKAQPYIPEAEDTEAPSPETPPDPEGDEEQV